MSQALIADASSIPAERARSRSAAPQGREGGFGDEWVRPRALRPDAVPAAPPREPGQLWLVEAASNNAPLAAFDRAALTRANIVIYDRTLAPIVAALLPLGGYAEPAPAERSGDVAVSARSLHFALDGWSVVELVATRTSAAARAAWLKAAARQLLAASGGSGRLPVLLVADSGSGTRQETATDLAALAGGGIDAVGIAGRLTVLFGAIGRPAAPHLSAVLSNGLAG